MSTKRNHKPAACCLHVYLWLRRTFRASFLDAQLSGLTSAALAAFAITWLRPARPKPRAVSQLAGHHSAKPAARVSLGKPSFPRFELLPPRKSHTHAISLSAVNCSKYNRSLMRVVSFSVQSTLCKYTFCRLWQPNSPGVTRLEFGATPIHTT